jgi:hypothetical protein
MAIYNADGSVKVADAKATVTDKLKSAWASITTVINPFSKDTISSDNKTVDAVLNSPITRTVIAGGLIAGGAAAVVKAAPAVVETVSAAKNAITIRSAGSAATATAAEISAAGAGSSAKNLIIAGATGAAAGYILSGSGGASNKSAIDQKPNQQITPDVDVQPKQDTTVSPYINPQITPNAYQSGTGNILNQNTITDTFTYTENFSPQNTWTYTSASGEQATDATADQTASGSNSLMTALLVAGAVYLFSKN